MADSEVIDTPVAEPVVETPVVETPVVETPVVETPEPDGGDWRSRMAGDDDKLLGYLGRYQSEKAFVEAAKKDRDAVRNRTMPKLADSATDEEIAAYRKELGIPDKPEGYLDKLDGLVVGDDDKPFVDKFLESMHGANANPAIAKAALETYYNIVEEQETAQAEADSEADNECITALRDEWGGDYKRNANVLKAFIETMPEGVAAALTQARGPDGKILSMNAEVMRWLTGKALEENPLATVVPGFTNQPQAIADEKAAIEKRMRDDRSGYNKDEAQQARYRQLIEAELKMKKAS